MLAALGGEQEATEITRGKGQHDQASMDCILYPLIDKQVSLLNLTAEPKLQDLGISCMAAVVAEYGICA